ncbi:DUF1127 domain-containing protein [Roseibium sp. Sym1]|uniref:DUF1127 domain-containing protein n=1 Tax=Roseibium sp. Sym1 TaxID=3016006 RepID=UPI0022B445E8|nr:DUF1127 domain-containing protein [Roseibium sp. Sym1]
MSSIETITARPVARLRPGQSLLKLLLAQLLKWRQAHRTRLHLLELSDHELEDLGLSRAAAHEEAMRPFWDTSVLKKGRS